MERIVIEVTADTAKKWRLSSQEKRNRILQKMSVQLIKELLHDDKDALFRVMDKMAGTAKENGITEEILKEILAEDE